MAIAAGADGAGGGWMVCLRRGGEGLPEARFVWRLEEVWGWEEAPDLLCVDIPIGLLSKTRKGGRECEKIARCLLEKKGSSVFSSPARAVLDAKTYEEAQRLNMENSCGGGISISKQAWAIVSKIKEVDFLLESRRGVRRRVREVHPELCFYEMKGEVVRSKKTRKDGKEERLGLLESSSGLGVEELGEVVSKAKRGCSEVKDDDVIDAMAALWTAERALQGKAICIPERPPEDEKGLPMGMWR